MNENLFSIENDLSIQAMRNSDGNYVSHTYETGIDGWDVTITINAEDYEFSRNNVISFDSLPDNLPQNISYRSYDDINNDGISDGFTIERNEGGEIRYGIALGPEEGFASEHYFSIIDTDADGRFNFESENGPDQVRNLYGFRDVYPGFHEVPDHEWKKHKTHDLKKDRS